jgi:endonuclease/exonuclease/phosphatase family metal-dependent hydrolase
MTKVVCFRVRAYRFVVRLTLMAVAVGGSVAAASADTTVTLSAPGTQLNADVTIRGGAYANVDYSNSDKLESKLGSADYTRRILLKFDTQNTIPANAVIKSAQIRLVLKSADSSEKRPLTVYWVTRSFVNGQVTWKYFRDGQAWSHSGGDLGSNFGTTYVGNAVGSTFTFDVTRLVQNAVNGVFGTSRYTRVALIDTGGSSGNTYKAFHSSQSSSTSLRPRLVVTYATSTTTSTVSSSSSGSTLRVMQWNIHKTKGSDGVCNPDRIANQIVRQNPQVVSLNEVNFYSGSCAYTFDMGAKLESLVEQKTGATWYRKSVNVEGGSSGTGNVVLSRLPLVSSSSDRFSYNRGAAQVGVVVNGRTINILSTHMEYYTASWRTTQIKELLQYMSGFTSPRIVLGDFNTWPGTNDYNLVATPYQDAWAKAKSLGTAGAYNGTGATHGDSRFDYVFYSRVSSLVLRSVNVPDTRVNGVRPSDHDPVVAVFAIP